MASDPKYGGREADYNDALARIKAQDEAASAESRYAKAAGSSEQVTTANVRARLSSVEVIQAQATAISASAAALERETALLQANTLAWARSTQARGADTAASRAQIIAAAESVGGARSAVVAPPTVPAGRSITADYSPASLAAFEAQAQRAAAAQVAISAAQAKYLASHGLSGDVTPAPSKAEKALEALKNDPQVSPAAAVAAQAEAVAAAAAAKRASGVPSAAAALEAIRANRPAQPADAGLGLFGPARPTTAERIGRDTGKDFGPRLATTAEEQQIQAQLAARAALEKTAGSLASATAGWRAYSAETAAASQALVRHGALSTEFISALGRGEVTLQEFGSALTATIGKFAGWAVAGGLVYTAFDALKRVVDGATATATGVAQLERAGLPGFNRFDAERGFSQASARLNVPIAEVSEAQFYAARAGFNKNQDEALSAGETAILAQKLDQVPIQEAARGLGAVRVAFGLNATQIRTVFNELDVGQLKFNARLQQTLPYLGRSAAAFAVAGGTPEQLVRQIVEVTGAVPGGGGGGGSGSAATFFTREPGNLRRPLSQNILREYGFNPNEGIGDLNETLQRAAKAGITPSGDTLTNSVRFRLAEAISGGPALAGRYGIQLINAGASGRSEEVNKELAKSQGAAQEDLNHKLGQFNEQVAAIGTTFERIGQEIGQSGLTAAGEDFLSVAKKAAEAIGLVAGPLANLGNIFASLPPGVQDLAVIGAGAAGVSKLGGFNLLANDKDREYVSRAGRTNSEAVASQKNAIERRTRELESLSRQEIGITQEARRFKAGPFQDALSKGPHDPESIELQRQAVGYDERRKAVAGKSKQVVEQLVTEKQLLLTLEGDEQIINDRRLQVNEKAALLRQRGLVVAQGSLGANLPLIGPQGEIKSSTGAQARTEGEILPGGARQFAVDPKGVAVEQDAVALALANAARGTTTEGRALDESLGTVAKVNVDGAAGLKDALGIAGSQIASGGRTVYESFAAAALAIRAGYPLAVGGELRGAAGGLGEIAGGAALGAGSVGSRIGANALKGVMYAFIGSAISEIAGEALTSVTGDKGVGSTVGGIGSDVALGAGAGALFGAPEIGAGIGLVGGILDQSGVFGGGSQSEREHGEKLKAEAKALEESGSKNAASIAGVTFDIGTSIEASIRGESEAAVKAKEKVSQQIARLASTVKVFGAGNASGAESLNAINFAVAAAEQALVEAGPENLAKALAIYEEALSSTRKATEEILNNQLNTAQVGPETQAAVNTTLEHFQKTRIAKQTSLTEGGEGLGDAEARRQEANEAYKESQEKRQKELEQGIGIGGVGHGLKGQKLNAALYDFAQRSPEGLAKKQADAEIEKLRDQVQKRLDIYVSNIGKEAIEIVEHLKPLQARYELASKFGTGAERKALGSTIASGFEAAYTGPVEENARAIQKELKEAEAKRAEIQHRLREGSKPPKTAGPLSAGFPAEPFGGVAFEDPSQLEAQLQGSDAIIQKLAKALAAIFKEIPGLKQHIEQLGAVQLAGQEFSNTGKEIENSLSLNLFNAGGNGQKENEARDKALKEAKENYDKTVGKFPKSTQSQEDLRSAKEQAAKVNDERLAQIQAEGRRELSDVPKSDKAGRAAKEAEIAQKEADATRKYVRGPGSAAKILEAEARAKEASQSAGESGASEASAVASLRGQIRQAQDTGNPIAQANDAIATAHELIGLAKNEQERLSGTLALINAQIQFQQAVENTITEIGALTESKEINPGEKTRTKLGTLRKNLAKAKTPQEKRKYETDLNNESVKAAQEEASEEENRVNALLHMHEITNETAIRRLQGLLKLKDITKAGKLQIEQQIYDLESGEEKDFGAGNIRLPTLYGARTAALLGASETQIPGTHPLGTVVNQNIVINVSDAHRDAHKRIAAELKKSHDTHGRAKARSAV